MAKKHKSPNANASLYEGTFELYFDCVGDHVCSHARFFTNPPEIDDDCVSHKDGTCVSGYAREAAVKLLAEKLNVQLEEWRKERGDD